MERKEFLNLVGISVGAVILQNCLSGCSKESSPTPAVTPPTTPPTGGGTTTVSGLTGNNSITTGTIDFTLDLNSSTFSDLKTNGKALISGDIIVARTKTGDFLALAKACTHAGTTVDFVADSNIFLCSNHSSEFNADGSVKKQPATAPLKSFKTTFDSTKNTLRVS
ncbi:MAG: Rieske (2Fe-2S) protein [Arcicella sp.]|nr:Rieske (2Fe-2S) protein [Arcicella sp.]